MTAVLCPTLDRSVRARARSCVVQPQRPVSSGVGAAPFRRLRRDHRPGHTAGSSGSVRRVSSPHAGRTSNVAREQSRGWACKSSAVRQACVAAATLPSPATLPCRAQTPRPTSGRAQGTPGRGRKCPLRTRHRARRGTAYPSVLRIVQVEEDDRQLFRTGTDRGPSERERGCMPAFSGSLEAGGDLPGCPCSRLRPRERPGGRMSWESRRVQAAWRGGGLPLMTPLLHRRQKALGPFAAPSDHDRRLNDRQSGRHPGQHRAKPHSARSQFPKRAGPISQRARFDGLCEVLLPRGPVR